MYERIKTRDEQFLFGGLITWFSIRSVPHYREVTDALRNERQGCSVAGLGSFLQILSLW